MERGLCASVRLSFTRSEAEKYGLLDRFEAALAKQMKRNSKKRDAAERIRAEVERAKVFAAERRISHRRLLSQAGISWGSWKRIERGQVNARVWLPKIQAALDRVIQSRH